MSPPNDPHQFQFKSTKGLVKRVKLFARRHRGMTTAGAANFLLDHALKHFEAEYDINEQLVLQAIQEGLDPEIVEVFPNG